MVGAHSVDVGKMGRRGILYVHGRGCDRGCCAHHVTIAMETNARSGRANMQCMLTSREIGKTKMMTVCCLEKEDFLKFTP